jgi:hypothetical protein
MEPPFAAEFELLLLRTRCRPSDVEEEGSLLSPENVP